MSPTSELGGSGRSSAVICRTLHLSDIGPVVAWMKQNQRPPREAIASGSPEIKSYWTQWESLVMVDGVVYRNYGSGGASGGTSKYLQLLMPRPLRPAFLELVHGQASGHLAWRKTQDQVQRRAYWASWKTDTAFLCLL